MFQAYKETKHKGFTLVELMFSMVFISLLILSITMTILQVISIYNRGLLMKEVNQTGRTVTDQMQRTIGASIPSNVIDVVMIKNPSDLTEETGGRFCLSNYSYIWNYGKTLKTTVSTPNVFKDGTLRGSKFSFIKVPDTGGSYCKINPSTGVADSTVASAGAVEILSKGAYSLVLHDMRVVSGAVNYDKVSNQRLYYIDITVGTSDYKAIDATTGGRSCKAPSQADSDQEFCSINNFSFVARAGNT